MAKTVADGLWEMLVAAGVRRCYGIVGDALNPVIDALRRNGSVDFVHVRHEEYGAFAAVADARLTGQPVAVCGTAGPGMVHLVNGLLDARKEGAPLIAIAGDVTTSALDSDTVEELNPYVFFAAAALYTGRLVNPGQLRAVVNRAITAAVAGRGPAVIALPGDVAAADAPAGSLSVALPAKVPGPAFASDLAAMAALINEAQTVAIFGGDGCSGAQAQVRTLAGKLNAPVGYSLKGKQWLEHDNPNAVGMTGLLGYGGCWGAINHADVLLMLGTDFPFPEFLPRKNVKIIQVDRDPAHLGRRAPLELGVAGDVTSTMDALLPMVAAKPGDAFLRKYVRETERFHKTLQHYVTKGPGIKPIRPEYLAALLSELADDDALFFADTGTACIWAARHITYGGQRQLFGSFSWASMANAAPNAFGAQLAFPGRQTIALCGDGGFTMLGLADLLTQVQRHAPVVHRLEQRDAGLRQYRAAGGRLHPVRDRLRQPGLQPCRRSARRQRHPHRRARRRTRRAAAALSHKDGPVVVDVLVDRYALARPVHVPGKTAAGFTLSLAKQALHGQMDDVIATVQHNVRLL